MKKEKKIIIIIAIIIALIIVGILIIKRNKSGENESKVNAEYVEVLEDGTKLNTSNVLNKDKMVDGLLFKNIQLTNKDGVTVLLADVTNTNTSPTEITLVDIIILDNKGNELGKASGIIGPLAPEETTQFNTSMGIDYANAYDFRVVKK